MYHAPLADIMDFDMGVQLAVCGQVCFFFGCANHSVPKNCTNYKNYTLSICGQILNVSVSLWALKAHKVVHGWIAWRLSSGQPINGNTPPSPQPIDWHRLWGHAAVQDLQYRLQKHGWIE